MRLLRILMRLLSAWRRGWILLFAMAAQVAHAVPTVCVQTQAQLVQALNDVRYTAKTIQIKQGIYNIDSAPWYNYNHDFMQPGTSLRGGYTANCASRQIAAYNTVLRETTTLGAEVNLVGNLTFEGLTFSLAHGLSVVADREDGYAIQPGTTFEISRSVITGAGSAPLRVIWLQDIDRGGEIKIIDSLVVGNAEPQTNCILDIGVSEGSPVITMINDTVYNNAGVAKGVCVKNFFVPDASGNGVLLAHNNIFYGNGGADLYTDFSNLELVDNIIGVRSTPPPTPAPIGTLSVNPQLDASFHPIESPPSPAINSGEPLNTSTPATDLDGGPRVVGSRVDRGAYESSLSDAFVLNVTNNNDAGAGSLRNAILSANADTANALHLINFAIGSGCGPHVITLATPLPFINSSIFLGGYSQPGSSQNTLDIGDDATICIVLDGATNNIANGLHVPSSAGNAVQVLIDGLAFSGFGQSAINLAGGSGHTVIGSHIGGVVGGVNLSAPGTGVSIGSGVSGSSVGGSDPATRNVIGDAIADGVLLNGPFGSSVGAHNNQISNNYIGVGWSNNTGNYVNRGNGVKGVHVMGYSNTISDNLIGFNGNSGIELDGAAARTNTVENNLIGIADDGTNLANVGNGVGVVFGAHDNTIRLNNIQLNMGTGVRVVTGQGNKIRRNTLRQNAGLGIDLAGAGITANDDDAATQPADYANRGQNLPFLMEAIGSPRNGSVEFSLTTTAGDYTVDIYSSPSCDAPGNGEGARWLASKLLNLSVPGFFITSMSFTLLPPNFISDGSVITATATDSLGNTSEFSHRMAYTNDVIFADGFQ